MLKRRLADRWTDGQLEGWIDGQTRQRDRWTVGQTDRHHQYLRQSVNVIQQKMPWLKAKAYFVFCFVTIFNEGACLTLSQSSRRLSIYLSLIRKSHSKTFLEPTSTKQ